MKRNKISSSGQLDETEMAVHGRKIPLDYIQQQINNDQDQQKNQQRCRIRKSVRRNDPLEIWKIKYGGSLRKFPASFEEIRKNKKSESVAWSFRHTQPQLCQFYDFHIIWSCSFSNKSGIQRNISRDTSCWYPISSWNTLSVYLGPVYIKWLGPTFIPLPLQDWTIFDLCNLLPIITA